MFFKSAKHKQRFLMAVQRKIYGGKLDPEYGSALYILTADREIWTKSEAYIKLSSIDIEKLLEEVDFSSGYRTLVKLAGNLFNGNLHVDPLNFMWLDESNFAVALTALHIRRQALSMEVFTS